jgi:hypothetical protein
LNKANFLTEHLSQRLQIAKRFAGSEQINNSNSGIGEISDAILFGTYQGK